ncbi:hypothetical protein COCVIDRAFT_35713 [Bipolaris victoriae FI3]|uniref:Uncharacterized protein n=1 Tax=Bipolaris victoriae (strain FI3) TaxID=930091 RepID=W7ETC1_BIPV3|nr:hypothetical protein COCVIDRAFT_35713 [Bipolaris victoriae FI3]
MVQQRQQAASASGCGCGMGLYSGVRQEARRVDEGDWCVYRGHIGSCVGRCCAADPVGTCPTRPVVSPQKAFAFASAGAGYRRVGEPCTSASASIPIPIPLLMPMATTASYRTAPETRRFPPPFVHPILSCPVLSYPALHCKPAAADALLWVAPAEVCGCRIGHVAPPLRWRFPLCLPDRVGFGMASTRPTTRLFAHMRRAMPHPTRAHTHPLCLGRHKFQPALARFVS